MPALPHYHSPDNLQSSWLTIPSVDSTIPLLSDTLTTSLASTGWPDRVRALALELLRSGTCTTFPELQAEVLRRAKIPPPTPAPSGIGTSGKDEGKLTANGTPAQTKKGSAALPNGTTTYAPAAVPQAGLGQDGLPDVRIPLKTVEEGVEFLKARVRDVVEVVEPEALEERGSSDEE
jgi:hypothetical protein